MILLYGLFVCKLPGAKDTICYLQRLKDINLLPFSFFFPFASIAATTHSQCHSETEVAIGWISGQRTQKDSNLSHPTQPKATTHLFSVFVDLPINGIIQDRKRTESMERS